MKSSHFITLGSLCFLAWLGASFFTRHPIEPRGAEKTAIQGRQVIPAAKLIPAQKRVQEK